MIALVHLVWGPLGPAPLRQFLVAYARQPAGIEHELVVLFNGVTQKQQSELLVELDRVEHRLVRLSEPVQDLAAYAQAASLLEHEHLCFVNSYSAPLAPDWLAKLAAGLAEPGAGMAGATGSWASLRSGAMNSLFLPNAYRAAMPPRHVTREQFIRIEHEEHDLEAKLGYAGGRTADETIALVPRTLSGSVAATLKTLPVLPEQLLRFPDFPAHHIRTNAFIAERHTLLALRFGRLRRKMDAWALESGRHSLTRQVERRGMRTLLVDRDGDCHENERWHLTRAFWQGDQEGLLVADNQTRLYANGGLDRRRVLAAFAWGPNADPRPPTKAAPRDA